MEASFLNLLIPGFILGFCLGQLVGRYSMAPYSLLLTKRQREQVENAVANGWPSWLLITLVLLASLGMVPVLIISVVNRSPILFPFGFFVWILIVAPFAVIGARTTNRLMREELERLRPPAT